ncbi:MAG TPA: diguanylate cyclase [Chloroflexota bacterium]|nr:diguanylate cyclase [Chloroflexota bacterium]
MVNGRQLPSRRGAIQRARLRRPAGTGPHASAQAARLLLVQRTAHALAAVTSTGAVCEALAETIFVSMGYHIVGIYLVDGAVLRLVANRLASGEARADAYQVSPDVGIIGHVWATNTPYLCHDTRTDPYYHRPNGVVGGCSEIATPLRVGTTIIGVLNVERWEPHAFTQDDLATLAAIADQAGVALQNARLYEVEGTLRRWAEARARRLEHIQRVGEQLKWNLEEDEVSSRLVTAVRDALGFRIVAISLSDHPGDPASRARVMATAGLSPEGDTALRSHDFALADVAALLRPEFCLSRSYFIPEEAKVDLGAMAVPYWASSLRNPGAGAWRVQDVLLVPLTDRQGGHLYGFLSVDDPESGLRPEREEVEALEIFADQAVVAYLLARARRQAERDPVTGLFNHRAANTCLDEALSAARRVNEPLSLIAMDVDHFKLINDTHGHLIGDSALRHVARSIERCVRAQDTVARLGGDEFLVILPGVAWDQALEVVARLTASMQDHPLHIEGVGGVPLRLSVGLAVCPTDAMQPNALFAIADSRLYEAKRSRGRALTLGPENVHREDLELDGFDLLSALVATVDNKDRYTHEHSEQVAAYACALADALGLSRENQRALRLAGLLHDVGKIGVPERILRTLGPLNADEWEAMKQHATLSTTLVRAVGLDAGIVTAVAHHHERWDGNGYPAGLAGIEVPLLGRIMILADAASAMTMDRPYRTGLSLETIIQELHAQAGRQFDPALVESFATVLLHMHAERCHEVA